MTGLVAYELRESVHGQAEYQAIFRSNNSNNIFLAPVIQYPGSIDVTVTLSGQAVLSMWVYYHENWEREALVPGQSVVPDGR
ncbi:hypothetical protein ANO14919_015050 [Xylariales sp. No.14919]|nr:hypothetical protein ANO14919_015050 [Xylariales sp. No.14919]